MSKAKRPARSAALVYEPRNDSQRKIRIIWPTARVIIIRGPAGVGKTTAALGEALSDVFAGRAEKAMLARPTVSVEEDLGFLPGDLSEKLGPWLAPFTDVLGDLTESKLNQLRGKWEPVPVGFLRGRTVKDATLIVDEAQNCTWKQLVVAGTRVGRNGRIVFCGDPDQSDLYDDPNDLPLARLARMLAKVKGAAVVTCTQADQVRDPFVNDFLNAIGEGSR